MTAHVPADQAADGLCPDVRAADAPADTSPAAHDTVTDGGPPRDADETTPLPSAAGRREPWPGPPSGRGQGRGQGPSPWEAERVRPLNRLQVEDRFPELGDLYTATTRSGPEGAEPARAAFLHRLACDVRRPGFALVIAEARTLTGCAYGYPVSADGQGGAGPDGRPLPRGLLRLARTGRLFAVSEIVVQPRVRTEHLDREWNLARRLQRRLLDDHGAVAGVAMVRGTDLRTVRALRSWGWKDWRDAARDDDTRRYAYGRGARVYGPCHVLTLDL
ncbi:hypothetical protein ACIQU5_27210 [Streptomyces sp. NPDC090306]|uniref:hypothetical protein n=1 Tax=Streptomyces sp. NPDC090306 TaxID=3365961 RepID=UPI0037FDC9D6